jgi:hypothetical protein
MLHREHVCIEIGNPLLALLRDSKVAQGISDIRSNRFPEEIWIVSSQICDAFVLQLITHSGLAKLVKQGRLFSEVIDVRELPDQIRSTYEAGKIVRDSCCSSSGTGKRVCSMLASIAATSSLTRALAERSRTNSLSPARVVT